MANRETCIYCRHWDPAQHPCPEGRCRLVERGTGRREGLKRFLPKKIRSATRPYLGCEVTILTGYRGKRKAGFTPK